MPRVTLIDKIILGGAVLLIVILLTIASTLDQSAFSPEPVATSTPTTKTLSADPDILEANSEQAVWPESED